MEINLVGFIDKIYSSITFDVFVKFAVLYFFIIWISVLLWVIKDISNRTNSIFLQIISVLIILFLSPLGIFIYLLIRPSNTLFEKYYQEIEENLDIFNEIIEERIKKSPKKKNKKNDINDDNILNIDTKKED